MRVLLMAQHNKTAAIIESSRSMLPVQESSLLLGLSLKDLCLGNKRSRALSLLTGGSPGTKEQDASGFCDRREAGGSLQASFCHIKPRIKVSTRQQTSPTCAAAAIIKGR